jgi:hypothetical protein
VGNSAFVFALIGVAALLLGLWIGLRQGSSSAQQQLDQTIFNERKLAEVREAGLQKQLDDALA